MMTKKGVSYSEFFQGFMGESDPEAVHRLDPYFSVTLWQMFEYAIEGNTNGTDKLLFEGKDRIFELNEEGNSVSITPIAYQRT